MLTLIISLILTTIGILVFRRGKKSHGWHLIMIFFLVFMGFFTIIHTIEWATKSIEYEIFVEKKNSFQQTLENSRENGNPIETAAIVKEVSEFNQQIAVSKYYNKHPFFGQYIDDRVENLEPIK